jgi:two-component system chemotaxis response regulator CheY
MSAGADDYLTKPVDRFAVQTRLVAAERVTDLHRQLALTQDQLEQANLELLEQSLTDQLTGLGNRRRMDEDLDRVHARALRLDRTYGIAIFDIDYFKRYNDHYGHVAGDGALRDVAACMDLIVRAGECAYRYGGEEFLVLMPDTEVRAATACCERIRQRIRHESWEDVAAGLAVTASVGVASTSDPGRLAALTRSADQRLYEAKRSGRDRVISGNEGGDPPASWEDGRGVPEARAKVG